MGPIFRRWTSPATRTSWNAPSPRYLFERKKESDPESKYPTIQRSNFFGKKWLVKRMGWFKKLSKIIKESSGISLSNKLMKWHDSFVKIARNLKTMMRLLKWFFSKLQEIDSKVIQLSSLWFSRKMAGKMICLLHDVGFGGGYHLELYPPT